MPIGVHANGACPSSVTNPLAEKCESLRLTLSVNEIQGQGHDPCSHCPEHQPKPQGSHAALALPRRIIRIKQSPKAHVGRLKNSSSHVSWHPGGWAAEFNRVPQLSASAKKEPTLTPSLSHTRSVSSCSKSLSICVHPWLSRRPVVRSHPRLNSLRSLLLSCRPVVPLSVVHFSFLLSAFCFLLSPLSALLSPFLRHSRPISIHLPLH